MHQLKHCAVTVKLFVVAALYVLFVQIHVINNVKVKEFLVMVVINKHKSLLIHLAVKI